MEEWRPIPGYDGRYEASNMGRIKSNDMRVKTVNGSFRTVRGRIKSMRLDSLKRYNIVGLNTSDGHQHTKLVHRLIYASFNGTIPDNLEINHINGNKQDNRLCNLELATRSENEIHKYKVLKYRGTSYGKFGSLHGKSKKVAKIDLKSGLIIEEYGGVREAARAHNIGSSCITRCCNNKQRKSKGYAWKYI